MIAIPKELLLMMGALVMFALACTWSIRSDLRKPNAKIDWWELAEAFSGIFLMLSMLSGAALQVVVRYLFADEMDIPWTEEFGRLAMIWAAFWGAAALQRHDDHIRMSAVYDLLPASSQKLLRIFADLLLLLIWVPIVWLGWQTARNLDIMSSISLGLPLSVFAYPVPIGGLLMMVHTVVLLIGRLAGRETSGPAGGFGA